MTKTAFITGATGYTGREVVRLACEAGLDTIAHIRPASRRRDEWTARFRELGATVDVTPWEREEMSATLTETVPELLFFLVGTTRARDRRTEEDNSYEAVDYGLLRLLVDACLDASVRPKLIYLSAIGVSENSRSAYMRARWRAEEKIRDSGLSHIIARPAMITGPGRDESRPMERLGGALSDLAAGGLGLVGARRLADRYRSMTNTELAQKLVDLALDGDIEKKIVESEELKR